MWDKIARCQTPLLPPETNFPLPGAGPVWYDRENRCKGRKLIRRRDIPPDIGQTQHQNRLWWMESWLGNNRRVLLLALVVPVGMLGMAAIALLLAANSWGWGWWVAGGVLAATALPPALVLGWLLRQPRIGFDGRHLVLYLRFGAPVRVPLEICEAFLLGNAPALLPGQRHCKTATATVVLKLAERAESWQRVDVEPALASWCDHYVTIRGTWCEPLSVALVTRLNERLAAAQGQVASPSSSRSVGAGA